MRTPWGSWVPGLASLARDTRQARVRGMSVYSAHRATDGLPTMYSATIDATRYGFADLKTLLAKASPQRSGDVLAGVTAESEEERVAAQFALADLPLKTFLDTAVVPYESDEVTRLIIDSHDAK